MIPLDENDLNGVLGYLGKIRPADLSSRFARAGGYDASSFISCGEEWEGYFSAVDGSNAMVLESGSFSVVLVRAVETTFSGGRRAHAGETPLRAFRIGPETENPAYGDLYAACFESTPLRSLENEDRSRAASVLRDTLEYSTALRLVSNLDAGDILVLDGALRVDHESHRPVLQDILRSARRRGVLIAAVTKMAASTWGGGIPLVPAAAALAHDLGRNEAWYLEVPPEVMDAERYEEWHFGDTYVASLHPKAPLAFKVEVPKGTSSRSVETTFAALTSYADDGRVTGYPFPLFDAHRLVTIGADQVEQVRQALIRGMSGQGMTGSEYKAYFGDIHDTFASYR
ncbi:DNA double-strand break repair nuclease NurA [Methanofollis aquaemaris]|uniref:DNA double-strand break repair nuclease NurA n=1 Tax=Methanofollis aquaemaris TaxID=126734 RepID=A0A8A3S8D1_9EURY|nr:DNA double-strand break repair nuclease NurA [Methanofollis aquaemaris]QSZ67944.1 DNA double-strand break repair nuclease NurA [Methanofollis aquaemaris]